MKLLKPQKKIFISSSFPDEYVGSESRLSLRGAVAKVKANANALPVYDDRRGDICRYNVFFAKMLVRHDGDGKKYLYDLLAIKKETSSPLE